MARMIRVYEVLANTDREGPAGDGTEVFRFRSNEKAQRFAVGRLCYGSPATVSVCDVPGRIARRWTFAG